MAVGDVGDRPGGQRRGLQRTPQRPIRTLTSPVM